MIRRYVGRKRERIPERENQTADSRLLQTPASNDPQRDEHTVACTRSLRAASGLRRRFHDDLAMRVWNGDTV
ncbi:MAG: hypothetical protein ABIP82_01380, partial [Nitrospirales bacterium]